MKRPRLICFGRIRVHVFIKYMAQSWPQYSLRRLHIRISWFSLYGNAADI